MKRIFYRFVSVFVLIFTELFYSSIASAADVTSISFTPPPTDLSLGYLGKLFGGVGGLLAATEHTVLGEIFKYLNVGILSISGVMLTYTTVRAIIDTAAEGESMGKKLSHWVIIRTVAGVGLLVPNMTNGYTMLQSAIMWMAIQGIGLADVLWTGTLDYLNSGGVMYQGTIQKKAAASEADPTRYLDQRYIIDSSDPDSNVFSISVLRSALCMQALQDGLDTAKEAARKAGSAATPDQKALLNANTDALSWSIDPVNSTLKVPGRLSDVSYSTSRVIEKTAKIEKTVGAKYYTYKTTASIPGELQLEQLNGKCGTYNWGVPSRAGSAIVQTGDRAYALSKLAGLQSMITAMQPLARTVLDKYKASPRQLPDDETKDLKDPFNIQSQQVAVTTGGKYQGAIAYYRMGYNHQCLETKNVCFFDTHSYRNVCGPVTQDVPKPYEGCTTDVDPFKTFYDTAKKQGWASAGGYYYNLIQVQQSLATPDMIYDRVTSAPIPLISAPRFDQGDPLVGRGNNTYEALKKILNSYPTELMLNTTLIPLGKTLLWSNKLVVQPDKATSLASYIAAVNEELRKDTGSEFKPAGDSGDPLFKFINSVIGTSTTSPYDLAKVPVGGDVALYTGSQVVFIPLNLAIRRALQAWRETMVESCRPGLTLLMQGADFPVIGPDCARGAKALNIYSPIEKLFYFGDALLTISTETYKQIITRTANLALASQIAQTAISVAASVLSVSPFSAPAVGATALGQQIAVFMFQLVQWGIGYAMPIAMAVLGIMFTMGITLSISTPLIPYVLFIFGIISWLIFVLEAMVAAPIVAIGLMDPRSSNDEILGRASEAQMLLFAVFLRPATMLIGLISCLILLYIALAILNTTFGHIISSFWVGTAQDPQSYQDVWGGLKYIGVFIVYVLTLTTLVTKCAECIYAIPDQILTWIGGHARPSTDAQMLQKIEQGISHAGETGKQAAGGAAEKTSGHIALSGSSISSRGKDKDKDKGVNVSQQGGGGNSTPPPKLPGAPI